MLLIYLSIGVLILTLTLTTGSTLRLIKIIKYRMMFIHTLLIIIQLIGISCLVLIVGGESEKIPQRIHGFSTHNIHSHSSQHDRLGPSEEDSPPWTWICDGVKEICVKTERSAGHSDQNPKPVDVCKLNCGKYGSLWPLPTGKVEIGKDISGFSLSALEFHPFQVQDTEIGIMLQKASDIFRNYLTKMYPAHNLPDLNSNGIGSNVTIKILTAWNDKVNTLTTDESYVLSIRTQDSNIAVEITANTYFGARHGLETLSQLIAYDEDTEKLAIVNFATISDKPAFAYRGVMIDTARNFFSIESLKRLIDGLSYTKLNILHWHLTDTQSFPFFSKSLPQLTKYGAYSKRKIYTNADVMDLIQYARIRGVKIVPEFDEPAHVGNGWQWGPSKGLGNLAVCVNQEPWSDCGVEPPCGQFNVVNDNVYEVLGKLYKDFLDLFDRDIFHMGGDEINFNCWNTTKEITDWMSVNGFERSHDGFIELWARFQDKAYEKLKEANEGKDLTTILWTSELTGKDTVEKYLSNSTYVIQIWSKGDDDIIPFLVSKNYRIILSNYDALYMDCGYGAWVGPGPNNWCGPYTGWQQVYLNSPLKILENKTSKKDAEKAIAAGLVLGGVSPMWSEQVDEEAMEGKVWPRAAALAERFWSNPVTSWDKAEIRFVHNRQRLVERGIRADGTQPEWCHQNEGHCVL